MSASLLIADYWHNRPRTAINPWRWVSAFGALITLLSFGAAFWHDAFGLFWEMVPVRTELGTALTLLGAFLREPGVESARDDNNQNNQLAQSSPDVPQE